MDAPCYGFVYLWFDRLKKRFYIGSHWGREDDKYVCSSSWMKSAYKNRPKDFRRKILAVVDIRENLLKEEQRWLDMIKPEEKRKRYYNLTLNALGGHHSCENRLSIGQKISKARETFSEEKKADVYGRMREKQLGNSYRTGIGCTEEQKAIISLATREAMKDPAVLKKVSEGNKNRIVSEETRAKISALHKGRVKSESERANISKSKMGKPLSEAHRQALRKPKKKVK